MTVNKITLPAFTQDEVTSQEVRQLVSALELRFQSLESGDLDIFDTGAGGDFSLFGHTHVENEITDLQPYLIDITGESIFDLSDVSGTPSNDDVLVWTGTEFEPQPASGVSIALNALSDVSVPSPNDGEVLTFVSSSGVWEASSTSGLASFLGLTDTDLSGQSQYDLVYNADGDEWQDTGGRLIWNADFNYLQLAFDHSINWLDSGFVTQELLIFNSEFVASETPERAYVDTLSQSGLPGDGLNYVNLPNGVIAASNFTVGDVYMVCLHAGGASQSGANSSMRLLINGAELSASQRIYDGPGGNPSPAGAGRAGSLYTTFTYASGDLQYQWNQQGAGSWINNFTMTTVNLTDLGPSNYEADVFEGTTQIDENGFTTLPASITIGDSVSDYMIFVSLRVDSFPHPTATMRAALDDGLTTELFWEERDSASIIGTSMIVRLAVPTNTTFEVVADIIPNFSYTANVTDVSITAIRLNAFDDYVTASLTGFTGGGADQEADVLETNFTSTAATGNWAFWASGLGSGHTIDAGIEIQADINSGGYNIVAFNNDIRLSGNGGFNTRAVIAFASYDTSIPNGADVNVKILIRENFANNVHDEFYLVAHSWSTSGSNVDVFTVGDPFFRTVIDGLTTNITSPATDIDGTLNVDGAVAIAGITVISNQLGVTGTIDGLSTLDILGAVDFTTTLNVGGIADFDDDVDINDATLRIWDSTATDNAAFSHDGADFNTVFTTTVDWNITGLTALNIVNYTFDVDQTVGSGQDNDVLTYDDGTGEISLEPIPPALTHTGEVTGDVALTVDITSITNRSDVVADPADDVAIHDDTDGTFKKVNLSSITDAGFF